LYKIVRRPPCWKSTARLARRARLDWLDKVERVESSRVESSQVEFEPNQWRRLHRARGARATPIYTNGWARGHPRVEEQQTNTDLTVLTVTKALTKTTNCTCRAKKVEGHEKFFRSFVSEVCPPLSGATAFNVIGDCTL